MPLNTPNTPTNTSASSCTRSPLARTRPSTSTISTHSSTLPACTPRSGRSACPPPARVGHRPPAAVRRRTRRARRGRRPHPRHHCPARPSVRRARSHHRHAPRCLPPRRRQPPGDRPDTTNDPHVNTAGLILAVDWWVAGSALATAAAALATVALAWYTRKPGHPDPRRGRSGATRHRPHRTSRHRCHRHRRGSEPPGRTRYRTSQRDQQTRSTRAGTPGRRTRRPTLGAGSIPTGAPLGRRAQDTSLSVW